MITIDLHSHTHYSHARDSVADMVAAAEATGLAVFGLSEHSPRPAGRDYPVEYRSRLQRGFARYVAEVLALRDEPHRRSPRILFGLEVDWFDDKLPYIRELTTTLPYDYLIGGLHFLGSWGFDFTPEDWAGLSFEECAAHYEAYYRSLTAMARSRLVHIAAHPDIIKIFTVEHFRQWLSGDNLDLVRDALIAVRDNGMAMEVSSAGLRKPCAEIYPCPVIMKLAADLNVPISFASDAHASDQIAWKFDELAAYAASFGYNRSLFFVRGEARYADF